MGKKTNYWENPLKCYSCGKDIYVANREMWAYKRYQAKRKYDKYTVFFCSWGCMRKYDAKQKKGKEEAS